MSDISFQLDFKSWAGVVDQNCYSKANVKEVYDIAGQRKGKYHQLAATDANKVKVKQQVTCVKLLEI